MISAKNIVAAIAFGACSAMAGPWLKVDESTVTECGDIKFSWGGGTPPYKFVAYAPNAAATITWVNETEGSSTWKNVYAARTNGSVDNIQLVFTLEDRPGLFAPPTKKMRILNNMSGVTCPVGGTTDFLFDMTVKGTTVNQCSNIDFTTANLPGNANVTINPPLKLTIVVPGVLAKEQEGNDGTSAISYLVNVAKDLDVLYSLRDEQDNQGGSTKWLTVLGSSDTACLGANTIGGNGKSSIGVGAIAGIVIGAVAIVVLIAGLLWFFLRRRNHRSGRPQEIQPAVDLFDATAPEPKPFKGGYAAAGTDYHAVSPYAGYEAQGHNRVYSGDATTAYQSESGQVDRRPSMTVSHSSYGPGSQYGGPATPLAAMPAPNMRLSKMTQASAEPQEPQYRIQADGGRVPQPGAGPAGPSAGPVIVDMPPTYNPDWQEEPGAPAGGTGAPAPPQP